METFSALLAICAGNSLVPDEFPAQRPVMRSFDVFFDLRLNKRLSKQSWGWWFETLSCPLWCHCNGMSLDLNYNKSTWARVMAHCLVAPSPMLTCISVTIWHHMTALVHKMLCNLYCEKSRMKNSKPHKTRTLQNKSPWLFPREFTCHSFCHIDTRASAATRGNNLLVQWWGF